LNHYHIDDIQLADGRTAYGFEKVVELAEEGNSEDDAAELKSLKNAGKILHCKDSGN
jgi:hypothetical protein